MRDFTQAIERIVAGLERKNRLLNPNEKRRVAYHEMGHAVVALALGHGEIIHKVSIIPRGISALGYTLSRPIEDRYLMEKNELEAKMAIALGGQIPVRSFEYSENTAQLIDAEVEALLLNALNRAVRVIDHYHQLIEEAAEILILKETLDETALKKLWNRHQKAA